MSKKRVLIIDALNAYLRAYIVDPSLSTNGQPIGGIKGFIKILQKLVRETKPDQIAIIWDGPNGSAKRKKMDKNYKDGRKPLKLNRAFHNLSDQEEALLMAAMTWGHVKPVVHYSQSRSVEYDDPKIKPQAHSDYIVDYFDDYGFDIDVMIEAKHKELALLRYRDLMMERAA